MNLADIRKKAQLESQSRQQQVQPKPLPAPAAMAEPVAIAAVGTAPATADVGEAVTIPVRRPAEQLPTPAVKAGVASAIQRFDPLAVILAGRELAELEEAVPGEQHQEAASPLDEASEEFLCFRVADEKYAISIMAIKEIIKPRDATEVPRMPRFINGIISLRGIIIPIFDMHRRLGLAQGEPTGKERVVIVRHEDGFCGILVDQVIQVVRLRTVAIEQPPAVLEGIDRDFVAGIGRHGDAMLILLNLDNILDLTLR